MKKNQNITSSRKRIHKHSKNGTTDLRQTFHHSMASYILRIFSIGFMKQNGSLTACVLVNSQLCVSAAVLRSYNSCVLVLSCFESVCVCKHYLWRYKHQNLKVSVFCRNDNRDFFILPCPYYYSVSNYATRTLPVEKDTLYLTILSARQTYVGLHNPT